MPTIRPSKQFERDLKRLRASGWNMAPFDEFIDYLWHEWPLPKKYEVHLLIGNVEGVWDIHIRQNWVVLLKYEKDIVWLLRTGTHASLGL